MKRLTESLETHFQADSEGLKPESREVLNLRRIIQVLSFGMRVTSKLDFGQEKKKRQQSCPVT